MKQLTQHTIYFLLGTILLLSQSAFAQVMDITEIPNYNKMPKTLPSGLTSIVDINSRLEIRPKMDAIRNRAQQLATPSAALQDLQRKQDEIKSILRNQQLIVDYFNRKIAKDSTIRMLQDFTTEVVNNKELEKDYNRFFDEYMALPKPRPDVFIYILGRFGDQLRDITAEMARLEDSFKVRFSLAAYRIDRNGKRPVHIENFDNIDRDEYYMVERWVTTLSPEEMQKLAEYKELANKLNTDANQVLANLRQDIKDAFPSLTCAKELKPALDRATQTLPDDLKARLEIYKTEQLDEIRITLMGLQMMLDDPNGVDLDVLKSRAEQLAANIKSATKKLVEDMGQTIQSNPDLSTTKSCLDKIAADLLRVESLLKYLRKVDLDTDTISDEVTAFSLDEIPELGTIDLKWTGKREQGDDLLIKAVLRYKDGDKKNTEEKTLTIEEKALKMYLVGPHVVAKAGMIMANSYTQQVVDGDRYRFAPTGAALLKFGSRKSFFFNNILSPGIGVNVCSTDFDTDGRLEIAGGISATIFRDIISVGWDWNFSNNKPFWFMGIHLPFNLPGQPVHSFVD